MGNGFDELPQMPPIDWFEFGGYEFFDQSEDCVSVLSGMNMDDVDMPFGSRRLQPSLPSLPLPSMDFLPDIPEVEFEEVLYLLESFCTRNVPPPSFLPPSLASSLPCSFCQRSDLMNITYLYACVCLYIYVCVCVYVYIYIGGGGLLPCAVLRYVSCSQRWRRRN